MLLYRCIRMSVESLTRRSSSSLPSLHDRSTQTSGCTHTLYKRLYICLLIDDLLHSHWMLCRASSWNGQTPCSTSIMVALFLTQNTPTTYMHKYIILVLLIDKIFSVISVSHIHSICCHNVCDSLREIWFYHMYELHGMMKHFLL